MSMAIEIRTAGYLKQEIAADATVEYADTVGSALQQLGLPLENDLILLVNDRPAYWKTALHDGDTLSILPGIAGGCENVDVPRPSHRDFSTSSEMLK